MAIIYTYPTKNATASDKILISDSEDELKTKQAPVSSIKDAIDVVDSIVAGSGISVSSATGNVTIGNTGVLSISSANAALTTSGSTAITLTSTPYSGGGNIGHVPAGGTSSNFLRGDGTWNTATIPLAADGTRGGIQVGYAENAKNYPVELSNEKAFVNVPWTDTNTTNITLTTTGTSGAATWNGTTLNIPQYSSGSGGVSSFTNTNGTFISAGTANSAATGAVTMGTIDLSATGLSSDSAVRKTQFLRGDNNWNVPPIPIEGFNTFSIYSAPEELSNISPAAARTIIRQSVCETECTIGFVDFMRFAGVDPISVFVYSGTISSPSTASLKLSGSQAPGPGTVAPTANSINTIQFKDASLNPQTHKFSAGENIVIVVSLAAGTVSGGGVSIAGDGKLISTAVISRQNSEFMIPEGFTSPNAPNNSLEGFLEDTSAENATSEGYALHFYNAP
jgi:hypothetical protein